MRWLNKFESDTDTEIHYLPKTGMKRAGIKCQNEKLLLLHVDQCLRGVKTLFREGSYEYE